MIFLSNYFKIPSIILSDSRFKDLKETLLKNSCAILLKGVSGAIVAGTESRNYLIKLKFEKSNIFEPYDVVDNEYFTNHKVKNSSLSRYILSVGRFIEKKNLIRLLNAFEIYKKSHGNLDLLLIGSGPDEDLIRSVIANSRYKNSVHIKSWQQINTLPNYYKNAAFFVLASTNDQWGLVVNEALASGTLCLVSKECGCCIDLIDEGLTGWSFNPYDENELSELFHRSEKLDFHRLNIMKI